MSKKKICFVAQFPPPIHGLSKAVETLYTNIEKYEVEKINITNNKYFLINIVKILKSNAGLFYFTISQTRGGNIRDLIILKILELKRKKCLIHLHGGYYRRLVDENMQKWQRKANYKAIEKTEGAIVLGESLRKIFFNMLPSNKIFVVPNCVDNQYMISSEKFEIKISKFKFDETIHVLYLSNFIKTKGYREVLELAKYEKDRYESGKKRKFNFDFAGNFFEESEKLYFENYIKKNKLEDYIIYHGVVDGIEKKELLEKCNVFVLLTQYPNEGQPISILEAMGNGLFVVTTRHAGIPDIVKNRENGIMVEADSINAKEIFNKMVGLSKDDYCKCMKNNYLHAQYFSEKRYISNLEYIFNLFN